MQTNIIWTGRQYHSIENCILTTTKAGNEIISTIIGDYDNLIFKIGYRIRTNGHWQTTSVNIRTQFNNLIETITLEKIGEKYLLNGNPCPELDDIIDIDISATPFTNSLPINRLKLKDGEQQIIDVIYFDIFERKISPVKQVYKRLTSAQYIFENYDKTFKANILVDEQGLVVDYEELFKMTIKHESNYSQ